MLDRVTQVDKSSLKWYNKRVKVMEATQYCSSCQNPRPVEEFADPTIYKPVCFVCGTSTTKARRKCKYGLSVDDHAELLHRQAYECAICKIPLLGKKRSIDHNHITGKVRGILCHHCNSGLGFFRDNIEVMKEAIQYIEANQ